MKKTNKKAIVGGNCSKTQTPKPVSEETQGPNQGKAGLGSRSARIKHMTVNDAVLLYSDFLSNVEIYGAQHLENTKATLNKFAAKFGHKEIHKVAKSEIQEWLEANWQNYSIRDKHIYIIRGYFKHARDCLKALPQGFKTEAEYLVRKLHKRPKAAVLTIEEVTKLLSELHDQETILAVVLLLFGFMRENEVLKSELCHYSLTESSIFPYESRGWFKPRIIPMSPNLRAMLEVLLPAAESATKGGMIFGKGVFERVRSVAKANGIKWQHNTLRHCCSSYAVGAGATFDEVAVLSGHNFYVFKKHFWVPVAQDDARRYWEISVDLERLKALPWRSRSYLNNLRSRLAEKKAPSKQLNLFEL